MTEGAGTAAAPREVETALVIRSESPASTARQVSELASLDDLVLDPQPTQSIADRYVDTPTAALGSRRLALRLREVDGAPRLTLKGDAVALESGTDRLEVELPWSREAFATVLAELDRRGISVHPADRSDDDPIAQLTAAGLEVVQVRETTRHVRAISDAGSARLLAELDLDAVTYRLANGVARLHEVEIEARSPDPELGRIVAALRNVVPALEPWPYSKLATGKAVDRGLVTGELRLGPHGLVTPAALDWLARALASDD